MQLLFFDFFILIILWRPLLFCRLFWPKKSDGWFIFSFNINAIFFSLRFPYALHCVPIVSFYLLTRRWYSKRLNSFACLIWSSLVAHHSRHNQCTTMHNKMVNWLLTYYEESMKLVEKNMFRKEKKIRKKKEALCMRDYKSK